MSLSEKTLTSYAGRHACRDVRADATTDTTCYHAHSEGLQPVHVGMACKSLHSHHRTYSITTVNAP